MNVNRLFKCRQVLVEMIESRGYDVSSYSNFSVNEVEAMLKASEKKTTGEMGVVDLEVSNDVGSKLYVKHLLSSKLRISNFNSLITEMIEEYVKSGDTIIFVLKDKINNMESFNSMLESFMIKYGVFVQIFCLDNLLFNITKHMFVPKMRILSVEEKQQVMEKYAAKPYQMPQILKSDPHAKFVGVKKGDLCEIIRPSETSCTYISYRYCSK